MRTISCPDCNRRFPEHTNFCSNCGRSLAGEYSGKPLYPDSDTEMNPPADDWCENMGGGRGGHFSRPDDSYDPD